MSDQISKIEKYKKAYGLSSQDLTEILQFCQRSDKYIREPVTIRQFIESKDYLDSKGIIYPEIMRCLEELNSGQYSEAVLTGGIGVGKSSIALYTSAYQLYLLSCMRNPHQEFRLDPSSEIVFIFQSLNLSLAKCVDFDRFRAMISKSPYFQKNFPSDPGITSELRFPNRIIVKPVVGTVSGTIGHNVIGGLIDEIKLWASGTEIQTVCRGRSL